MMEETPTTSLSRRGARDAGGVLRLRRRARLRLHLSRSAITSTSASATCSRTSRSRSTTRRTICSSGSSAICAARGMMDGESRRDHFTPFLIPIGGPLRRTADRRVLLAGDAGGFVNGFSAEGIYYAMVTGDLAAAGDSRRAPRDATRACPRARAPRLRAELAAGDRRRAARLGAHPAISVPQRRSAWIASSAAPTPGRSSRDCSSTTRAGGCRTGRRAAGCSGISPGCAAPRLARVPSQAGAGERMTRAVLFDLDDTLFDHHRSARRRAAARARAFAPSVDLRRLRAPPHAASSRRCTSRCWPGGVELDEARRERFRRVFRAFGITLAEDQTRRGRVRVPHRAT